MQVSHSRKFSESSVYLNHVRPCMSETPSDGIGRTKGCVVISGSIVPIGFTRVRDRIARRVDYERPPGPARLVTPQFYRKINNFSRNELGCFCECRIFIQDSELGVIIGDPTVSRRDRSARL
jgi:hypothetical protein